MSLKQAEDTLTSAQTLLEKLGGERGRWDAMATGLNSDLGAIAANALLAAGFVTYLADEQEAFRAQVLTEWAAGLSAAGMLSGGGGGGGEGKGKPAFSLLSFLSSEGQLLRCKPPLTLALALSLSLSLTLPLPLSLSLPLYP